MNAIREEQLLRAIKATADLVGYTIKKVSTGDDLKMRTMTIAFETASSGHVQEVLNFERDHIDLPSEGEPDLGLEVMTDGDGHVEHVRSQNGVLDPSDLTETDETQASGEIGEASARQYATGGVVSGPDGETPEPEVLRDPAAPLVGELAAAARKRR